MGSRASASASISFGLVHIPVKLYLGASSENIKFNLINPATNSPIEYRYFDKSTGEEVSRKDLLKGYEYSRGNYVTFTKEELDNLESPRLNTIDVQECVKFNQIDLIQIEKSYYLAPDKGGDKAYRLFMQVLEKKGMAAVGKYYARGKDYLVIIRSQNDCLVLHQMYFTHEVREPKACANIHISNDEMKLASKVVDQITSKEFDCSIYHDEYSERVQEAVEEKIAGKEVVASPAQAPATMHDLLDALKQSIGDKKQSLKKKVVKKKKTG